ncbi:nucleotidyltransferase family protein [uncultured Xanthomonas sp.]|uniref:nucleotidyltransferase family protein n=1 Tax=uncultured Xanthomonas sp. TaxID=152831 RepID=UPI0025CEE93B|nr:nucleotidyltransferase family protein [uncultured Xanthomonas sp.]
MSDLATPSSPAVAADLPTAAAAATPAHLPLRRIGRGLRLATETLAHELARPGAPMPDWSGLHWQLAAAAAVAHGVAPLLSQRSQWPDRPWRAFLEGQREHVAQRYQRIAALLQRIDALAQTAGLAIVPLKGAALHAQGLYRPGDRPMADIDLLVRPEDAERAATLLAALGYVAEFAQWKHQTFRPAQAQAVGGLGENRDTPINIELHVRIQERLPLRTVDLGTQLLPGDGRPGLNPYPSNGALMRHLLLHAAGGLCSRSLRLMHLHDLALLAPRMRASDWQMLTGTDAWWAWPPLRLMLRYYRAAIPSAVLKQLRAQCPPLLRLRARGLDLTAASCSQLWLPALPGIEWARSGGEVLDYLRQRLQPSAESRQERAEMIRTQLWLQGQDWVRLPQRRRVLQRLLRPVPRMDTLYAVRTALQGYAPSSE